MLLDNAAEHRADEGVGDRAISSGPPMLGSTGGEEGNDAALGIDGREQGGDDGDVIGRNADQCGWLRREANRTVPMI